jgi:hypothetical protein
MHVKGEHIMDTISDFYIKLPFSLVLHNHLSPVLSILYIPLPLLLFLVWLEIPQAHLNEELLVPDRLRPC